MADDAGGIIRQEAEGPGVSYLGTTARFRVLSSETDGNLSIVEFITPPGPAPGPPAHTHPHAETFYVLDGTMAFLLGDRRVTVEAGAVAFVPGGLTHTFANAGGAPARFLTIFTPGGFEMYFEEVARLVQSFQGEPPDMARVAALAARYNQTTVGPPLQVP